MHETGALRTAVAELTSIGGRITRVTIAVGPGHDLAAVRAAWAVAVVGTTLAEADVRWQRAVHELTCLTCAQSYHGDRLSRCPSCGGDGLVVEAAPELEISDWATDPG